MFRLNHTKERVLITAYPTSDFGLDQSKFVDKGDKLRMVKSLKILVAKSESMKEGKIIAYPHPLPKNHPKSTFCAWIGPDHGFDLSPARYIRKPVAGESMRGAGAKISRAKPKRTHSE